MQKLFVEPTLTDILSRPTSEELRPENIEGVSLDRLTTVIKLASAEKIRQDELLGDL